MSLEQVSFPSVETIPLENISSNTFSFDIPEGDDQPNNQNHKKSSKGIFENIFQWLDNQNIILSSPEERNYDQFEQNKKKIIQLKYELQSMNSYSSQQEITNSIHKLSQSTAYTMDSDKKMPKLIFSSEITDTSENQTPINQNFSNENSETQNQQQQQCSNQQQYLRLGNSNLLQRRQQKQSMRMVSPNIEARKKLLLETTNQNLRNNSSNRFNIQAKKISGDKSDDQDCESPIYETRSRKLSKQISKNEMEQMKHKNERLRKISREHDLSMLKLNQKKLSK